MPTAKSPASEPDIEAKIFLAAAKQHGEDSEPDHEAGDIQTFFRAAFKLLTPRQRSSFACDQDVMEIKKAAGLDKNYPSIEAYLAAETLTDPDDYVGIAETFGKQSETELNVLKSFFRVNFDLLDKAQRRALVDDDWVQDTLSNAVGLCDVEPGGLNVYQAAVETIGAHGYLTP